MQKKLLTIFCLLVLLCLNIVPAMAAPGRLAGRIVLAVEERGEAWYVNPANSKRYYLGRPADAFNVMRRLGLGVTETTYASLTHSVPDRLLGRIIINVQQNGQAYYIYPVDRRLYYLGRPADAFNVMRRLGLGISSAELAKISIGQDKPLDYLAAEKTIQELVNRERLSRGLASLQWNDDLARVAREHSQNQAADNLQLINQNKLCSYPFIHHEGQVFGLYHNDRLNNRGIYYFSASAENIALIPRIKSARYESSGIQPADCQKQLNQLNASYEERVQAASSSQTKLELLRQEIINRQQLTTESPDITIVSEEFNSLAQVEAEAITGWMNSPGHRQNILNPVYNEAGVGMAEVNGYFIITQVFIERASCGYRLGNCCQKAGYYPYCYLPWDCNNNICQ